MLATLGFLSVVIYWLCKTKKLTPTVALLAVPTVMPLLAGLDLK